MQLRRCPTLQGKDSTHPTIPAPHLRQACGSCRVAFKLNKRRARAGRPNQRAEPIADVAGAAAVAGSGNGRSIAGTGIGGHGGGAAGRSDAAAVAPAAAATAAAASVVAFVAADAGVCGDADAAQLRQQHWRNLSERARHRLVLELRHAARMRTHAGWTMKAWVGRHQLVLPGEGGQSQRGLSKVICDGDGVGSSMGVSRGRRIRRPTPDPTCGPTPQSPVPSPPL
eukprot:335039-Chlamydomonas_euryale.AAC.1